MSTVHLGLGSNLGDRQGNILQTLQKLRARARIEVVSAYYESPALAGATLIVTTGAAVTLKLTAELVVPPSPLFVTVIGTFVPI